MMVTSVATNVYNARNGLGESRSLVRTSRGRDATKAANHAENTVNQLINYLQPDPLLSLNPSLVGSLNPTHGPARSER